MPQIVVQQQQQQQQNEPQPPHPNMYDQQQQQGPPPAYPGQQPPAYPPAGYKQPPQQQGYQQQPPQQQPPAYPAGGYQQPPPQQGYQQASYQQPPPRQMQQSTVIVQQPRTTVWGGAYGTSPCNMDCPYCSAHITTSTSKKCSALLWIVIGVIVLVGIFIFPFILLGCCLIPLCIPSLYDTQHDCPNCQRMLGKNSAM